MKRRHFFKSLGSIAGGTFLSSGFPVFAQAPAFKKAASGMVKDEKFWTLLRKQFLIPADYVYLNTGGLGSCPYMVSKTVRKKMAEEDSCPRAGHNEKEWWKIKERCARLLGPSVKKEELAFTGTATEGINIILNGLPLQKGDEIITSSHEHVALNIPLLNKRKRAGIVIRTFSPDREDGLANVKAIERLINKRTRLIFTSHITCTTGQIMPVNEIGELARSKGIWYAIDGAQALAQMPVNIQSSGVDFYAVSGHKWLLGPRRTGILYVRERMLDTLHPTVVGAYSSLRYDMAQDRLVIHPTAQRYEYGTQNEALFYGLEAAVDFITTVGIATIREHNKRLSELFYNDLKKIKWVKILSPEEETYRSSMITFQVKGKDNAAICRSLERKGIRVRSVTEGNLDAVRVSFHVYNNEVERKRLLTEINKL